VAKRPANRRGLSDQAADAASGWREAREFRPCASDVSGCRRSNRRRCWTALCRHAGDGVARPRRGCADLGRERDLTGALHEDGLADVADGFGGGRDPAAKLEIMLDSRLGTYGALILMVSFVTKLSALTTLGDAMVVQSLIAAHALARGVLPVMAMSLDYARKDGLAVNAGRPDVATAAIAAGLALAIALLALPLIEALYAAVVATVCATSMAWLAQRQIGGQTGDVLGSAEQLAETAILVLLAIRLA